MDCFVAFAPRNDEKDKFDQFDTLAVGTKSGESVDS